MKDNLFFYSSINSNIPDEINITIVYKDYNATNINTIQIGTFLFIDNFLGELNAVTIIDNINIIGPNETEEELIKIEKLNDFLIWREKEFIEKHESIKQTTDDDSYVLLEAKLKNGYPVIALMNSELLKWEEKASYQWILTIDLTFDGSEYNGLPNKATMQTFNDFEEDLLEYLNDENGQLNIGRETSDGIRTMYFACKDFREPSKTMAEIKTKYASKIDMNYEIFKDKYWTSLNYFIESVQN